MGPGRRMHKQGPPPTIKELNLPTKRKADESYSPAVSAKKANRSIEDARHAEQTPEEVEAEMPEDDSYSIEGTSDVERGASEEPRQRYRFEGYADYEKDASDQGDDEPNLPHHSDLIDDEPGLPFEPYIGFGEESDSDRYENGSSGSVLDSEEEQARPTGFSDDDSDGEELLTAANMEGLSRKLDQEQKEIDEQAQRELEDDAIDTNIGSEDEGYPSKLAPDLQLVRTRITESVRVLGDFARLSTSGRSRSDHVHDLILDICIYYGYNAFLAEKLFRLFSPAEAFAFFEANESPRPLVIRTNTLRTNRRTLAQALINRGVVLEPVGRWSKVGLQVFEAPVPMGATPEYLAGHYMIQSASSFLPVMALAPEPGERILDMAAAPGGKTTYMSALMRNTGMIFANDASKERSKGLIGNIHRLGCKNTIVSYLEGQESFPKLLGGFDRVLLDAPCSGTGVISKDPSVKTSKNERDFLSLPQTQKKLLLAAIDSTNHDSPTGGYIVYSTCSVTVEENEQVVQYALKKRPNVTIVETGMGAFGSEGFQSYMSKHFDSKMTLARRYYPHRENVDGFFVCKLKKTGPYVPGPVSSQDTAQWSDSVNGNAVSASDNAIDTSGTPAEVETEFGPFDDEEDARYILKSRQRHLRSIGLDPRTLVPRKEVPSEQYEQYG